MTTRLDYSIQMAYRAGDEPDVQADRPRFAVRFGRTKAKIPNYRSRIKWEPQLTERQFDTYEEALAFGQTMASMGCLVFEVLEVEP